MDQPSIPQNSLITKHHIILPIYNKEIIKDMLEIRKCLWNSNKDKYSINNNLEISFLINLNKIKHKGD